MVTRCVCYNKRFSELKRIARTHRAVTLEQLQRYVRFGLNCKRCHPYVRLMLKTGQTKFEPIPIEKADTEFS
jgi:bacterioferritin-associated ferredoxin